MADKLTWHGHANFQISANGLEVLIDPWFEGNPSATCKAEECGKVDLVLVTHDHDDHLGQAVEICKQTKAMAGAIVETAQKLVQSGVPSDQILNYGIGFNIGGTVEFKGLEITMVQAFHSSATGQPVGYILTLPGGFTIYHAGDTGLFSSLELWGQIFSIDLALLPIGGVFTMDPKQAALACKLLKTRAVIPMHWGSFPMLEKDTTLFAKELRDTAPQTKLIELEPGQSIELQAI